MNNRTLQMQQLEDKMKELGAIQLAVPLSGWVKATRNALGISLIQMGNKLKITKQSAHSLELREKQKSITLKSLEDAAKALDMKLVYGFVPMDGSLEKLIEKKAQTLATEIVQRIAGSMVLDDKKNSDKRLQKAIQEKSIELRNTMPKALWD